MLLSFLLLTQFTKCDTEKVYNEIFFECDIEDLKSEGFKFLEMNYIYPIGKEQDEKVQFYFLKKGQRTIQEISERSKNFSNRTEEKN